MLQAACSQHTVDRYCNVVQEDGFDVTTLLAPPAVSTSQPLPPTMDDVKKLVSGEVSVLANAIEQLTERMDRTNEESTTLIFPSHETADKTSKPDASAEIGSSQA